MASVGCTRANTAERVRSSAFRRNKSWRVVVQMSITIRVHRQTKFAQRTILCFQYLGFHDHTFNRAKSANYVISPGIHGQACHGQATEFSCPGFHDKQQNSLPMHCNDTWVIYAGKWRRHELAVWCSDDSMNSRRS